MTARVAVNVKVFASNVREVGVLASQQKVQSLMDAVTLEARNTAPKKTGQLRGSHQSKLSTVGNRVQGKVENTAPYARYVHDGTGLYGPLHHLIYPRRAKVMVFQGRDGKTVFARHTRGMPGRPWLRQALETVMARQP